MKPLLIAIGIVGMILVNIMRNQNKKGLHWILIQDGVLVFSTIIIWEGSTLV
jgi:FtsH-binding integral membrane protein